MFKGFYYFSFLLLGLDAILGHFRWFMINDDPSMLLLSSPFIV